MLLGRLLHGNGTHFYDNYVDHLILLIPLAMKEIDYMISGPHQLSNSCGVQYVRNRILGMIQRTRSDNLTLTGLYSI